VISDFVHPLQMFVIMYVFLPWTYNEAS